MANFIDTKISVFGESTKPNNYYTLYDYIELVDNGGNTFQLRNAYVHDEINAGLLACGRCDIYSVEVPKFYETSKTVNLIVAIKCLEDGTRRQILEKAWAVIFSRKSTVATILVNPARRPEIKDASSFALILAPIQFLTVLLPFIGLLEHIARNKLCDAAMSELISIADTLRKDGFRVPEISPPSFSDKLALTIKHLLWGGC